MSLKREGRIDIVKGIGIILVVLGHVTTNEHLFKFIYSFHMPLFFFVSGHFAIKKNDTTNNFLLKKTKTLLWPYLVFYLLTYFYWLFIEKNIRAEVTGSTIEWWYPLFGLVYGTSINNSMINNTVLWFLPCVFSVSVLYFFLRKKVRDNILLFCLFSFFVMGYLFFKIKLYSYFRFPFSFDIALCAILFYGIGNLTYNKIVMAMDKKVTNQITILILSIFLSLLFFISQYNQTVNMMAGTYGNPILFIIGSFSGIILTYLLAKTIDKNSLLQYLGKNSLLILVLHGPLIRILLFIISKSSNLPVSIFRGYIFSSILVAIFVLLILTPFIQFVNNKIPILIVYSKKNK